MLFRSTFSIVCLGVLVVLLGCGGTKGKGLKTVPVGGTVTYKGNPVDGAAVAFHPADPASGGRSALGTTDAQGKYTLQTHEGGVKFSKGALVGDYVVLITLEKVVDTSTNPMATVPNLSNMTDDERRKLASQGGGGSGPGMPTGGDKGPTGAAPSSTNAAEKSMLPPKYADQKTSGLTAKVPAGGQDFDFALTDN